jgi:hypothetical protein
MVSYSQNDISSIILIVAVLNVLPNILKTYSGPQFLKAIEKNDIVRNLCVFLGIILLTQISNYEGNKFLLSFFIFGFLLLFSRQTILFNLAELLLISFIFIQYNKYNDFESIKIYLYLLLIIGLLGYENYYKKQLKDKGLRFSLTKFIFGKKEKDYEYDYVEFQPL